MIELIEDYLWQWIAENKVTLIIIGVLIGFIYHIDHQYRLNYQTQRQKIVPEKESTKQIKTPIVFKEPNKKINYYKK